RRTRPFCPRGGGESHTTKYAARRVSLVMEKGEGRRENGRRPPHAILSLCSFPLRPSPFSLLSSLFSFLCSLPPPSPSAPSARAADSPLRPTPATAAPR